MFPGNFQKQTLDMSWKKTLISEQYTHYAQESLKTFGNLYVTLETKQRNHVI